MPALLQQWFRLAGARGRTERKVAYDGETDPMKALAITIGPCELVRWDTELAAEVRRKETPWWTGGFLLDGVTWIDYGSDPNPMFAAFESGEIDIKPPIASPKLRRLG